LKRESIDLLTKGLISSISETVCVLGIAISTMSLTTTIIVSSNGYDVPKIENTFFLENSLSFDEELNDNIYEQEKLTQIEREAMALFGTMRDATIEERESIDTYIKSISIKTGVNFFDIC